MEPVQGSDGFGQIVDDRGPRKLTEPKPLVGDAIHSTGRKMARNAITVMPPANRSIATSARVRPASVSTSSLDGSTARRLPRSEQLPNEHELADVIRRVVGHEHDFAQISLPGAMRNSGGQLDLGIGGELLHGTAVAD